MYDPRMTLHAIVRNGRYVIDQPATEPEGTEFQLVEEDPGDDMDDEERAAFHEELYLSYQEAREGKVRPVEELLAELRASRRY